VTYKAAIDCSLKTGEQTGEQVGANMQLGLLFPVSVDDGFALF
jgi:hypothetical protein